MAPRFVMRETWHVGALKKEAAGMWREGNDVSFRHVKFPQTFASASC